MDIAGYRDIVEIGRGRASTVYRALQESTGRTVAIKVLTVTGVEERLRRRFERESTVTERLAGHPHIAEVVDRGYTGAGHPFITTAYYDHGSLEDRLARSGPLAVEDVLRIGVQVAGALEVVHQAGILHRDVKPSNVLESVDGEPALTGFGISAIDPSSQAMTMAQSFAATHTPPEVVLGQAATEASDTYQLGSTLYTLLAGHAPFETGTDDGIVALLGRIQAAEVPAFDRPDVPAAVLGTLRSAMAKDPAARPGALALARELQARQRELGQASSPLAGAPEVEIPPAAESPAPEPPAPEPPVDPYATAPVPPTYPSPPAWPPTYPSPAAAPVPPSYPVPASFPAPPAPPAPPPGPPGPPEPPPAAPAPPGPPSYLAPGYTQVQSHPPDPGHAPTPQGYPPQGYPPPTTPYAPTPAYPPPAPGPAAAGGGRRKGLVVALVVLLLLLAVAVVSLLVL